jgi:hypothetical protein
MEVERKIRIDAEGKFIAVDLVFKGTSLLQQTPFYFTPGDTLECISYDQAERKWMKTWIRWPGPRKGDLLDVRIIRIFCRDESGFTWESPLMEFLNPGLFNLPLN